MSLSDKLNGFWKYAKYQTLAVVSAGLLALSCGSPGEKGNRTGEWVRDTANSDVKINNVVPIKGIGMIAFTSNRDNNLEIYVMNTDGSEQKNLTSFYSGGSYHWSPDGTRIAMDGITIMNANGSNVMTLASGVNPVWSPDGQKIAYVSEGEIYVMDSNGNNKTNLTNNLHYYAGSFSWSPDGKKIAFEGGSYKNEEIYVMNADGSNQINLTNHFGHDYLSGWSPDGTRILFTSNDHPLNNSQWYEVHVMDPDGSNHKKLTDGLGCGWSPDGQKIAFLVIGSTRSGFPSNDTEIHVMNADGSEQKKLTDVLTYHECAVWSP